MRRLALILAPLALGACAGGAGSTPILSGNTKPAARPAPATPAAAFRKPQMDRERGLEDVLGQRAATLIARYGKPRIDLGEGDARKLQFAGENCVLDIFLYPLDAGEEPVATHVEARQRQGGASTDKARCLAEIERR